ncbi:thioredoxin family protein [Salimicrobium halophilum]|uniref:Thiol-disulfide isomerase or thioredoxin n=1 Tax=Salimicrobium halophilum TaxID=86666 RepID=A0A1G8VKH7_9BACI|nr:thioredoxin family protein [Salimicrobium halophilum]SDJ66503.1 Thiol-disulfide isomerase or thioredoxin [Salimicrobium halophilum]
MKQLESKEQFQQLIDNEKVIFMFSADWCPDCRVIEPVLPELEEENPEWTFYYVDRDQFIDVCADYSIFGIPSFLAFENADEKARFVSKDRKSKEEIQAFIDEAK